MTRQTRLQHQFVESFPDEMDEGQLYIALGFRTMGHKCACGCGLEVVTPLSPRDWRLAFDGEAISVWPSVGNWSFPCQSHYWIKGGSIEWSGRMTKEQIERVRRADQDRKDAFYNPVEPTETAAPEATAAPGLWTRIRRWFG